ncbi:MAG: hypothetical protein RIS56_2743 [Verrucomicrobiota bacterium]
MAPLENEKKGRYGLIDDGVPVSKIRIADLGANSQFSRVSAASTATTAWCIELRLFPELPQRVNHGST